MLDGEIEHKLEHDCWASRAPGAKREQLVIREQAGMIDIAALSFPEADHPRMRQCDNPRGLMAESSDSFGSDA